MNEDNFESAGNIVHKAMQIAQQVSRSKPIMWVVGATAHLSQQQKELYGNLTREQNLTLKNNYI